jgi:4-hydroxy-2-oxoheptanedioate aldolase
MATLKEKMASRPVFGMTVYSGSVAVIESLGYWGYDFAFIDGEHTSMGIDRDMEKLVMAAQISGVSPLVRVAKVDAIEIRKAFEMGAEGVIIPHIHDKREAEDCVKWSKFPPYGRRGVDGSVRSAHYGAGAFNWDEYMSMSNNGLVLPMAEDYEFMDNIDEIMDVPGIDGINFGPADFASSLAMKTFYKLDEPVIQEALKKIIAKAKPKKMHVMAPVVPPNAEKLDQLIEMGVDMLILGNDIYNQNKMCSTIMNDCVKKYLG